MKAFTTNYRNPRLRFRRRTKVGNAGKQTGFAVHSFTVKIMRRPALLFAGQSRCLCAVGLIKIGFGRSELVLGLCCHLGCPVALRNGLALSTQETAAVEKYLPGREQALAAVTGLVYILRRHNHRVQWDPHEFGQQGKLLLYLLPPKIKNNRAETIFGKPPIDCAAGEVLSIRVLKNHFDVCELCHFCVQEYGRSKELLRTTVATCSDRANRTVFPIGCGGWI